MDFLIMHETVTSHDAIGNDIELMWKILNEGDYSCQVFAINRFNKKVTYIEEAELEKKLKDTNTVIIYHHSVYWKRGEELLGKAKGRIIFRYHNITPEKFFQPYNDFAYHQCKYGREQTVSFQRKFPDAFWLSDSLYNAKDLEYVGKNRQGICPPFNKIEEWSGKLPDENILRELIETDQYNLLFVGRVAPNKGHLMLIEVLRYYCSYYDTNVKLRIIGKFDEGIQGYNELVMEKIHTYGLDNVVEFIGEINDSTLMAYYLGSDVMLCCSEHEGFCVPVIEAQFFKLPVIALDECAVPETIGQNQVVLSKDIYQFAAALKIISDNSQYVDYLRKQGRDNYNNRFTYHKIRDIFEREIMRGLR